MLKLTDIVKEYGQDTNKVLALRGVSLEFRKNEFVSILGPSGCGKTTLLNIIGGLDRYTSGDLVIEGKSTKNYNDKDWDAYRNNSVGFVFQSYNLIPHQTVIANVELALELSGISKAERKRRAMEMLEKVGLTDQAHKKPNQLSGGQMQRVAIARALINNPEIILADEPTGALDTETSIQIMELLKEIAKDKLVIMVTHNPEIAEKYSTRIIKLLDGKVVDDSSPYEDKNVYKEKKARKPKMGFKTALLLSLKNLFSKKARTILTSVAGSIGIIGVALVLALSNGFNIYMARMQTDTLSTYPLTISESTVDLSTFKDLYDNNLKDKYADLDNVFVEEAFNKLHGMLKSNNLTNSNGYLDYLGEIDSSLYYDMEYEYGFDMNKYLYTHFDITLDGTSLTDKGNFASIDYVISSIQKKFDDQLISAMGISTDFVRQYIPTVQAMPNSKPLIEEQYDVLAGRLPSFEQSGYNETVLVVDEFNGVSDITLAFLGLIPADIASDGTVTFRDTNAIDINKIISTETNQGQKYYLANNALMYSVGQMGYTENRLQGTENGLTEIKIVGIIRAKDGVAGILDKGLAYTPYLTNKVIQDNADSDIVNACKQYGGYMLVDGAPCSIRQVAGVSTPSVINIYAKDFDSKALIKEKLDAWNNRYDENDEEQAKNIVSYSDMMSDMFGMLNTMVSAVTYVLVAFTSISLVVSSVMIGIITYISVVERTKEIGVLRSLGASKGEIKRVFNAETFLIGLFAGTIGVLVTYLMSIPINLILGSLIADVGSLAVLNPFSALALIVISICLTLVAGLIPAGVAAKKDPVVALRTE